MMANSKNAGFTLLEVLISLVIFTIGLLGIMRFTGNVMFDISDNELRAAAINSVYQRFTQIRQNSIDRSSANAVVAAAGSTALETNIRAMAGNAGIPVTNGRNNYNIRILSATDSSAVDVLTAAVGTVYASPISVGVRITYTGKNGLQTIVAPFVFN